jgi:hypothetical protein
MNNQRLNPRGRDEAGHATTWFNRAEQIAWTATSARRQTPTASNIAAEQAAFAMVDRVIDELRGHVSQTQLEDMQKRRERLIVVRNEGSSLFRIS